MRKRWKTAWHFTASELTDSKMLQTAGRKRNLYLIDNHSDIAAVVISLGFTESYPMTGLSKIDNNNFFHKI